MKASKRITTDARKIGQDWTPLAGPPKTHAESYPKTLLWFHNHGYGNAGATSGHIIPDCARVLNEGWRAIHAELETRLADLPPSEQTSPKAAQLLAMRTAATMARDLAAAYAVACLQQAAC